METRSRMLVAIEGIDASGKHTQTDRLRARAQSLGLTADVLSFPRYGKTLFADMAARQLNGEFGDLASVDPHFSSLLYAGDRFESKEVIVRLASMNDILFIDRYVASNLAYQAARVGADSRSEFISWLSKIEYDIYGLPRADLTIYLDLSAAIATKLLLQKRERSYTTEAADIYERDAAYLASCRQIYQSLAQSNFESKWVTVECAAPNGGIRDLGEITDLIWQAIDYQKGS